MIRRDEANPAVLSAFRVLAAASCCLAAPVLYAQTSPSNEPSDRYIWAMEETGAEQQAREGISPEAYDKVVRENLRLREQSAKLSKSAAESREINEDLMERIKALESARQENAKADLAKVSEDNRSLQAEVEKLRAEVGRLQELEAPAGDGAAVSKDSDLFKRLQKDNVLLANEVQKNRDVVKRLEEELKKATVDGDNVRQKVRTLAEEKALLGKAVLSLDTQTRELAAVKKYLAAVRRELDQKNRLIAEYEKEMAMVASALESPTALVKQLDASRKERGDLLFNLGVLYAKAGRFAEAVVAFERVLETQPEAVDVHFNLGVVYDKNLADRKKAEFHYKKFLELDPLGEDAEQVKLWLGGLAVERR